MNNLNPQKDLTNSQLLPDTGLYDKNNQVNGFVGRAFLAAGNCSKNLQANPPVSCQRLTDVTDKVFPKHSIP